jgi:uncharacterized DUF497 family protein
MEPAQPKSKKDWDENIKDPKHKVHVIDFRKLKLLNPQTTLSQDLATKNTAEKRYSSKCVAIAVGITVGAEK